MTTKELEGILHLVKTADTKKDLIAFLETELDAARYIEEAEASWQSYVRYRQEEEAMYGTLEPDLPF